MVPTNFRRTKPLSQALIVFSRFFRFTGLSPKYDEKTEKFIFPNWLLLCNLTYTLVLLIVFTCTYPYRLEVYKHYSTLVIVWDVINSILLVGIVAIYTFEIFVYKKQRYVLLFNEIIVLDREMERFDIEHSVQHKLMCYVQLVVPQIIILPLISYRLYAWFFAEGVSQYRFHICEYIQKYHAVNLVMLACTVIRNVEAHFENINGVLRREAEDGSGCVLLEFQVRRLYKAYVSLLRMVRDFNDVFGSTLVMILLQMMQDYLLYFNNLMSVHTYRRGTAHTSITVIWMLFSLWVISTIAVTCGNTTKAAKETGPLCYDLCSKLKKSRRAPLYNELLAFARVASSSDPVISAAGFFTVDQQMLNFFFTVLISYVIVILQLYQ